MASSHRPLDESSSLVGGAQAADSSTLFSRGNLFVLGGISVTLILVLSLAFGLVKTDKAAIYTAVAKISNETVTGAVVFTQSKSGGPVTIALALTGIPASTKNADAGKDKFLHGMHIHAGSDLSNFCMAAGGHLNVTRVARHGAPNEVTRHTGDLGNHLTTQNGATNEVFTDNVISLDPNNAAYVGNKAFVIHADYDDLGLGNFSDSATAGHAGSRIACGVIVAS